MNQQPKKHHLISIARINPTVSQRPRISIPNLPKNPNRGRPRSQSKGAPVSMATASTNTVASALSQARASGVLSQLYSQTCPCGHLY
jgi:hypothetical protein